MACMGRAPPTPPPPPPPQKEKNNITCTNRKQVPLQALQSLALSTSVIQIRRCIYNNVGGMLRRQSLPCAGRPTRASFVRPNDFEFECPAEIAAYPLDMLLLPRNAVRPPEGSKSPRRRRFFTTPARAHRRKAPEAQRAFAEPVKV